MIASGFEMQMTKSSAAIKATRRGRVTADFAKRFIIVNVVVVVVVVIVTIKWPRRWISTDS